jgi:hypothetical protein
VKEGTVFASESLSPLPILAPSAPWQRENLSSDICVDLVLVLDVNLDGDGDLDVAAHVDAHIVCQRSPARFTLPSPSRFTSMTTIRSTANVMRTASPLSILHGAR